MHWEHVLFCDGVLHQGCDIACCLVCYSLDYYTGIGTYVVNQLIPGSFRNAGEGCSDLREILVGLPHDIVKHTNVNLDVSVCCYDLYFSISFLQLAATPSVPTAVHRPLSLQPS